MNILNFIKRKNTIIEPTNELLSDEKLKHFENPELFVKHEVDGAEVYLVSWKARYGEYYDGHKTVAKAFLTKNDAEKFANSLKQAAKLLQYTENLNIKITKQL